MAGMGGGIVWCSNELERRETLPANKALLSFIYGQCGPQTITDSISCSNDSDSGSVRSHSSGSGSGSGTTTTLMATTVATKIGDLSKKAVCDKQCEIVIACMLRSKHAPKRFFAALQQLQQLLPLTTIGHGLSSGGAVSHQYVSKPLQPVAYAAPAITKVAAVAPVVAQYPSASASIHAGAQSIKYGSSGAVSHQYVSKPLQPVSYAPASIAKVPAVAVPAVTKLETYAAPAVSQYSSGLGISQHGSYATGSAVSSIHGSGAISHQQISKSLQPLAYATPTITKVAAVAPVAVGPLVTQYSSGSGLAYAPASLAKVGAYAAPAVTHYTSGLGVSSGESIKYASGGAISHQQVSTPSKSLLFASQAATLTTPVISAPKAYLPPALGITKSTTYPLPGVTSIHSSTGYGGSSGSVSHQYVSKPAVAVSKITPYSAPAAITPIISSPAIAKVGAYASPGIASIHSAGAGAVGLAKLSTGSAISHQYSSSAGKSGISAYTAHTAPGSIGLGKYVSNEALLHQQPIPLVANLAHSTLAKSSLSYSASAPLTTTGYSSIPLGHGGSYYGAIALGHTGLSPILKLGGAAQSSLHGIGANLNVSPLKYGAPAGLPLLKGQGELLNGYAHGIGGIGPLGAGLYRYAPAVSPMHEYLRTATHRVRQATTTTTSVMPSAQTHATQP
ncbi:uncharacterized protein LOC118747208 [Rhagoletis pomonella]|uniref:uncharacterized protein LOC118747208 n=1 Tax=Rhagoletis pomonella TaxID=28610 RepID=UPI00177F0D85|nr:uncharacterized protein LOC118747208 [Rhagoletis pomonella]